VAASGKIPNGAGTCTSSRWSGGRWVCRCECGGETIAKAADLKHGKVRSCGCVRRPAVAHAPKPKPQCDGPLGIAVDHRAWSPVVRRVLPDISGGASALPASSPKIGLGDVCRPACRRMKHGKMGLATLAGLGAGYVGRLDSPHPRTRARKWPSGALPRLHRRAAGESQSVG
jgi:hypothetical protein